MGEYVHLNMLVERMEEPAVLRLDSDRAQRTHDALVGKLGYHDVLAG